MRWFRRGAGKQQVQHDPGRELALVQDLRERYGVHVQARFPDQADEVARLLTGDDGLLAAVAVVREFADAAYAEMYAQAAALRFAVDRRDYRPVWKAAAPDLRWPLFNLPVGLHPYIQVTAAVTVVATQARRIVRVTDPDPLLAHLFEILDLTVAGWEFARVRVDTDTAALTDRLITAGRDLRAAMSEEPPLPPPVRELMRRNNTIDVYDATSTRIVGRINPGKQMREYLLA
ncbi:hypothetical protein [Actinoplanes sp. NPDC051494]|uniref:hypothetical protein n=1 Tax=Actinoplanes sp. NPDC051494 TaxID=3363907 RepID=UPI0037B2956B